MHLPIGLFARLPQRLEKEFPVGNAAKDGFLMITAVHYVIDRPFKLEPELACHGAKHWLE